MIKKINEISDVWKFVDQISESDFSFLNSNKLLNLCRGGIREELLAIKIEVAERWKNGFLINDNQFYFEGKLESIFPDNTFKTLLISEDKLLVKHLDYEKEKIRYGIFSFSSRDVQWLIDFGGSQPYMVIHCQNLISTTDSSVKSFFLNNGNSWEKSYQDLTESNKANLHSRILNSDDKLFFGIDGNENRGTFVLDVTTGEVLKKFKTESYEIFKDGDYIYTTKFQNILCRINTKTLEIEEWDCNTLVKEYGFNGIHDHRCDVVNGKFCFTQSLGDNKAKLGVLDWKNKELVYKHDFEPRNGAIGSIHVAETRMFVNTQDNVLHIFKKM